MVTQAVSEVRAGALPETILYRTRKMVHPVNVPQVALVHAENVLKRREVLLRHLMKRGRKKKKGDRMRKE